jgi:hypothetical protein
MMDTNDNISDEDSDVPIPPFYASSTLSSSTPSSTVGNTNAMEDGADNIPSTAPLTTSSTNNRRSVPVTTASTSDDPVLAMADSFVDVFTSFGKLFSNIFNGNNKNDNNSKSEENRVVTVDTVPSVISNPSKESLPHEESHIPLNAKSEAHSTIPATESSVVPTIENIEPDTDKKMAFMNDIVTSLFLDEAEDSLQQQSLPAFDVSTPTVTATTTTTATKITSTDPTPSSSISDDSDDNGDDDDPFHMTLKGESDMLSFDHDNSDDNDSLESDPEENTNNNTTMNIDTTFDSVDEITSSTNFMEEMIIADGSEVIVQEVNGWITTTTTPRDSSSFSDDDNDDIVFVYDVDELDSWNQPLSPIDMVNEENDGNDVMTTISPTALQLEAVTITMTPSTDESDYFDENGNEILMADSDDMDDDDVKNNTLTTDSTIVSATSVIENLEDAATIETFAASLENSDTAAASFFDETKEGLTTIDNESMFEASNDIQGDFADVVMVVESDELDSWKIGNNVEDGGIEQLDTTTLTITETISDDEGDIESDSAEPMSKEGINKPYGNFITPTLTSKIDNIEETGEDDAFSDEEWQASVQMALQSMNENISGMIEFGNVTVQDDYSMGNESQWESAEQPAESLTDSLSSEAMESSNSDDDHVDMEALAKAARDAVQMFEQKYENEKQETKRQRELWTAQQVSVAVDSPANSAEDVAMAQSLSELEANWNQMTLAELKVELGNRGLAKSGTKAKLIARLAAHQYSVTTEIIRDRAMATSTQPDASSTKDGLRDWSLLKVAELKDELSKRGLPATGKKADLIAALKDSDVLLQSSINTEPNTFAPLQSDLRNSVVEDIDEVAKAAREAVAMFEQTNGRIDDIDDFDDVFERADDFFDENEDISINDFDMDALEKAARAAVLNMKAVEDDEPSDEALWEIENEIAMVDDLFLEPPDDQIEQLNMMLENIDSAKAATPKAVKRLDPPPNYASMAVSQLKEELNRRGLRVTGKKIDLIARLELSDKEPS